jgi:hypothetical protein
MHTADIPSTSDTCVTRTNSFVSTESHERHVRQTSTTPYYLCGTGPTPDEVYVAVYEKREGHGQKLTFDIIEAAHGPRTKAVIFHDVRPCLAIL